MNKRLREAFFSLSYTARVELFSADPRGLRALLSGGFGNAVWGFREINKRRWCLDFAKVVYIVERFSFRFLDLF